MSNTARRTGVHPEMTVLAGQVQTYADGTPILEGDRIEHTQAPGGMLPPCTDVGIAAFFPARNDNTLYLLRDRTPACPFDRYLHIAHGGTVRPVTS